MTSSYPKHKAAISPELHLQSLAHDPVSDIAATIPSVQRTNVSAPVASGNKGDYCRCRVSRRCDLASRGYWVGSGFDKTSPR